MKKPIVATMCLAGIAVLCFTLGLHILSAVPVFAQQEEERYFYETGHLVKGEFLRFFDQRGGLAILGYPLTEEFEQPDGRIAQYFQRARMEKHPENPEPYKVQLGLLGDELGYRQPPISESEIPPANHPDKKYFAETGHTVSFAFLEFYSNNGGLDIFGYPITEWIIEPNGRVVQYFQRAKMEWFPEGTPGQRVQLGMLGTIYAEKHVSRDRLERLKPGSNIIASAPTPTAEQTPRSGIASEVTRLQMWVTLMHPIIDLEGTQTVYVYLFDQANQGVGAATVEMEIQYKDGRVERHSLGRTNEDGYCQLDFEIGDPAPGYVVVIKLTARYNDLQAEASTAFLPWW